MSSDTELTISNSPIQRWVYSYTGVHCEGIPLYLLPKGRPAKISFFNDKNQNISPKELPIEKIPGSYTGKKEISIKINQLPTSK